MATIYEATKSRPRYLDTDLKAEFAGDNPDYFDVKTNKWYSTSSGSELAGLTGWTATGGTLTTVGSSLQFVETTTGGHIAKTISTVVGRKYKLIINTMATRQAYATVTSGSSFYATSYNGTFIGLRAIEFTADSTSTVINVNDGGEASYTILFTISVFQSDLTIGSEITPRNYLNNVVYADHNGQPEYVEEVAKVEYKDSMKLNKLSVTEGFDLGQTWQNMTSQRVLGATYTNTTGKPIMVSVNTYLDIITSGTGIVMMFVDGYERARSRLGVASGIVNTSAQLTSIVPNNSNYRIARSGWVESIESFHELR